MNSKTKLNKYRKKNNAIMQRTWRFKTEIFFKITFKVLFY